MQSMKLIKTLPLALAAGFAFTSLGLAGESKAAKSAGDSGKQCCCCTDKCTDKCDDKCDDKAAGKGAESTAGKK